MASESSNGTWTEVVTMSDRIRALSARAYRFEGGWVRVAYPRDLFEPGSLPQVWSSIAGNVFGMKALRGLRLEDVYWPRWLVDSFPGPGRGISGLREIMKVEGRPLLATVPKPKVGMTTEEHVRAAVEVWSGGVDLLKDDENLTDQPFNRFEERVRETLRARDAVEAETGERKSYLVNITAPYREMERRARLVSDLGGEFVMVDILTSGWSALQSIRELCADLGLAIHAHRAFHAAFTRNPRHGVSMKVVAESARLAGVDTLHVGTVVGKLVSPVEEVRALARILRDPKSDEDPDLRLLRKDWGSLKPALPVSSGGLHPGLMPDVIRILGRDIMIQAGGGVMGHPDGPRAGAAAVRRAVEAVVAGETLEDAARDSPELRRALEHWGRLRPV